MRKALILILPLLIIVAAVAATNNTGFSLEVPEGITGFFVQVTTSFLSVVKEVVKQVLLAIANLL